MKKLLLIAAIILFNGCSEKDLSAECKEELKELKQKVLNEGTISIKTVKNWEKKCSRKANITIPKSDLEPNPSDDGNFLDIAKNH